MFVDRIDYGDIYIALEVTKCTQGPKNNLRPWFTQSIPMVQL